jgi:hypothetical protein
MKTTAPAAAPATTANDEPRHVAVIVLQNRTKIGTAICAAGPCDFPLTQTEAEALAGLGLVRITGIF